MKYLKYVSPATIRRLHSAIESGEVSVADAARSVGLARVTFLERRVALGLVESKMKAGRPRRNK